METFWLIIAGIVVLIFAAFQLWLLLVLPMEIIRRIAKKRNLKEPRGWIYATYFLSWFAPLLYWDKLKSQEKGTVVSFWRFFISTFIFLFFISSFIISFYELSEEENIRYLSIGTLVIVLPLSIIIAFLIKWWEEIKLK